MSSDPGLWKKNNHLSSPHPCNAVEKKQDYNESVEILQNRSPIYVP